MPTPRVNSAGSVCTSLRLPGWRFVRWMRAMPLLCTWRKNFRKSVRLLCHTQASGMRRTRAPLSMSRIEKSMSSPKRIGAKPPSFFQVSAITPMLNERGWNFSICRRPPLMPPVVRNAVMA